MMAMEAFFGPQLDRRFVSIIRSKCFSKFGATNGKPPTSPNRRVSFAPANGHAAATPTGAKPAPAKAAEAAKPAKPAEAETSFSNFFASRGGGGGAEGNAPRTAVEMDKEDARKKGKH